MFRLPHNYTHFTHKQSNVQNSPSQASVNRELLDVQAWFRKGRGTRDQIANIRWVIENPKEFQKNIYFCFIDYAETFDGADHNKLWKILQEMGIPDHLTFIPRNVYAVKKQRLELDMEQWPGSKLGKEVHQGYILSPC